MLPMQHEGRLNSAPWRSWLLHAATIAVLAIVLIHCVTPILPQVSFDVDPRGEQAAVPLTVIGPQGAAWLTVLGVFAAAFALTSHVLAGGTIAWGSVALASAGVAACVHHMQAHHDNMHRAGMWIGAVSLALAAKHLVRHERSARWIAAALVAMIVPLAIRSALYYWVEHRATVEMFLQNEQTFLQARGWAHGSPQHELYRRRLMFPDVTGAFGLSNVFGSVVAAMTAIAATLAISGVAARRKGIAVLAAASCACGVFIVYLTHSKGAVAALAAAAVLGVAIRLMRGRATRVLVVPALAIVLMAGACLAVVARAELLGPPATHEGERSLLFRYYYWQGALDVERGLSGRERMLGVGPGMFKAAYSQIKNPLNPEEVTSTHNVLIDLLVTLGIGGAAWAALLLLWLIQAGRAAAATAVPGLPEPARAPPSAGAPPAGRTIFWAVVLAGIVFGTQFAVQFYALLSPESFFGLCIGAAAFVVITASLAAERKKGSGAIIDHLSLSPHAIRLAMFVAAGALLIHNQIEMTFFNEGSAAIAFFLVAAAAMPMSESPPQAPQGIARQVRWAAPLAMLGLALAMCPLYAVPTTAYESHLARAAGRLRHNDVNAAVHHLDRAAETMPTAITPYRWKATLLIEAAQYMMQANKPAQAPQYIQQAVDVLRLGQTRAGESSSLLRLEAQTHQLAAAMFKQPVHLSLALSAWTRVVDQNPFSLQDIVRLADLLHEMQRHDAAKQWYERAMMISDQSYLDPAKQLTAEERSRIERLLEGTG